VFASKQLTARLEEAAEKLDVAFDFGWRSASSAAVSALF
jgi:hypothetical protein